MIIVLALLLAGAGGWFWQQTRRTRSRAPGSGAGAGATEETIEDAPWWPVVLAIERDSHDPALAFQARTARLAWYSIPAVGRHPMGGGIEFTGLWQNRAGHWFYVDAVVTGADRGRYTLVLPATARVSRWLPCRDPATDRRRAAPGAAGRRRGSPGAELSQPPRAPWPTPTA